MLRKGRTREQASAQFAGEWDEGGAGNAFSTANRRFAPLKMPFLPYSGGPTQSGGLKGRGQCEALHSPETPGTLSAWPVRKSGGPTQSGGLKGRGQCEALHSPETPGTLSACPVRRRMSPKMIENERAEALSNSLRDFFDKLRAHPLRSFRGCGTPRAALSFLFLPFLSFSPACSFFKPAKAGGKLPPKRKRMKQRKGSVRVLTALCTARSQYPHRL